MIGYKIAKDHFRMVSCQEKVRQIVQNDRVLGRCKGSEPFVYVLFFSQGTTQSRLRISGYFFIEQYLLSYLYNQNIRLPARI